MGKNNDKSECSYLKSIFRAFQRELLWILGLAEDHFTSNLNT